MKDRPFGITLLAILAGVAALMAIIHTLQMLHLLPFNLLGEMRFWSFSPVGALMWGMLAALIVGTPFIPVFFAIIQTLRESLKQRLFSKSQPIDVS